MARFALTGCLVGLLLCPAAALATAAGQVTYLSGVLSAKGSDGKIRVLSPKSDVFSGDLLSTEKKTFAQIKFTDGGVVILRPASQFKIDSYHFKEGDAGSDSNSFSLVKGGLRAVTGLVGKRNQANYDMKTLAATLGIRGTHFGVIFCQDNCAELAPPSGKTPENGLHVDVSEGAVELKNAGGSQVVNAGEFAFARNSNVPPIIVPADQAVKPPQPSGTAGELFGKSGNSGACAVR